jgi:hypothetical protein
MARESRMTSTACPDDATEGWSGRCSAGNFTSQNGCRITSLRDMREEGSLAKQRDSKSLNAGDSLGSWGGGACMISSRRVLKLALM